MGGATPLTAAEMGFATNPALRDTGMDRSPPVPEFGASSGMPGSVSMPAATGVPVHGKDFFKRARNRLSFEAFNTFLAGIKRLNNQQQSREATLEEAHWIFSNEGAEELFFDFQSLLDQHKM